jgi:hypothetical protein
VVTKALLNEPSRAIYQASLLPTGASIAVSPINNQSIFLALEHPTFSAQATPLQPLKHPLEPTLLMVLCL